MPLRRCFKDLPTYLLSFYQVFFHQHFGYACKYQPTCSHYAKESLEYYQLPKALLLIAWRLLRCQPFGSGGYDPVPVKKENNNG